MVCEIPSLASAVQLERMAVHMKFLKSVFYSQGLGIGELIQSGS